MGYVQLSKKIVTAQTVDASNVKHSLVQRMKSIFNVETVGEGLESFALSAHSKKSAYTFNLNVTIKCDSSRVRIIVDGRNRVDFFMHLMYVFALLGVLALGLKPGLLGEAPYSYAIDAMFFLVVGTLIAFDYNRKLEEPQRLIAQTLDTLEVEFG